jgi:hypothetical protein
MISEASGFGLYGSKVTRRNFPKIQILTIEEVLTGAKPQLPGDYCISPYKSANHFKNKNQNSIFD